MNRHAYAALALCAAVLGACAGAQPASPQPAPANAVVVDSHAETPPAEAQPAHSAEAPAWTYSRLLRASLPVTPEELDDLQADSLYSASVGGRLVWLDLHGTSAREKLGQVRGPISLRLPNLSPELLRQVDDVAKRFPVAITYEPPGLAPHAAASRSRAESAQQDVQALGSLRHVKRMILGLDIGPEFPDLRGCTGLKSFELFESKVQDALYERLPEQLEELLLGSIATNGSPKALLRLTQLKRLELSNSREFTVRDLAPLTQLEDLDFGDHLTDADIANLQAFPELRRFVTSSPLTNAAIAHFAKLPKLRALGLLGTKIEDAGMSELAQLTQLEELTPPLGLSSNGIAKLAALQKLKTLVLTHSKVSDASMQELARLKELETLDLSFNQLTDASAPTFAKLTNLRSLDLSTSKVGDETARTITTLTQLRHLDLQGTRITNAAVPFLLELEALRVLHVNNTRLNSEGILALLALPNLHRYYTSVTSSDRKTFQRLVSTKQLLDSVTPDCDTRRIRLPDTECADR